MSKTLTKIAAALVCSSLISLPAFAADQSPTQGHDVQTQLSNIVKQTKGTINDAAITTKIKAAYLKNSLTSPFDINVTTQNGVVILSGKVNTDMEYEQAVMIAESTDNVKNVNAENLKVKDSKSPIEDTLITAKVKGLLIKEQVMGSGIKALAIKVETKDGVVYLAGKVKSQKQKEDIGRTAKLVDGVKSVKNDLEVSAAN